MIKKLFLILAALSICLSWLIPTDTTLWNTFLGEMLAFYSVVFLALVNFRKETVIPVLSLPVLLIAFIPIFQYSQNILIFSTTLFLSLAYLLSFWLVLVVSYSLSQEYSLRQTLMQGFCYTLLIAGVISSAFAILQWLNIGVPLSIMMPLEGIRPYANFGQPNHLATLLLMCLLAGLYLFETKKIPLVVLSVISFLMVFVIALTQSRTSWIAILFVIGIWVYKSKYQAHRVNIKHLFMLLTTYMICAFIIPYINVFIKKNFDTVNVVQTADIVQRATTEHQRLDLWSTALDIVISKPWIGHGWNQTGLAHFQVIEKFPYWFTSAHNIGLDILIWNGIILGSIIILYSALWIWALFKSANSIESIVAIIMVGVVLIHALLEYPLFYSYFLLPIGFLMGIASSCVEYKKINFPNYFIPFIVLIMSIGLVVTWKEYVNSFTLMANAKSIEAYRLGEKDPIYDQQTYLSNNGNDYVVLSIIEARAEWIAINPFTNISEDEILNYKNMVSFSPSKYDLYKYAQLLAYNGYMKEARYYLKSLEVMHGSHYSIEDILTKNLYGEEIE